MALGLLGIAGQVHLLDGDLIDPSSMIRALEMGKRHLAEEWQRGDGLDSPQRVRQYLSATLRDRCREVFAVIFFG